MATSALRIRVGALAAAAALSITGLALGAAPAVAEDGPTISLDRTSFPAGDWDGGFTVTGSGFDTTVDTATLSIGSYGENGGGVAWSTEVAVSPAGTISAAVVPEAPTQAPDSTGYPQYRVNVGQQIAEGQPWLFSNTVDLTITEGTSLTVAGEASPEQLAAGISAQFAGFGADEPLFSYFDLLRSTEGADQPELVDSVEADVTADASGAGTISAQLAGAHVGDFVVVWIGSEGGLQAEAFVQVVEAPAPAPEPADPAAAAPAAASTGPALAETGVEPLAVGVAAFALVALGALVVVARRRQAVAGR
ncbi:hypothetical protein [Agromyces sp. LHK192]|uniref:hypothetical protein n=1 Tax=Agromyces sp. LHK192 TaxID=2498704 RepID=UPI000FD9828C|nr:hypothetical protein [Agromyces sp. LHK192]